MKYSKDDFFNATNDMYLSWDTQYIIENILDRIENPNNEDDIMQSIDDELIYCKDQWTIIQEYCSPEEANWQNAIECFISDVYNILERIQNHEKTNI